MSGDGESPPEAATPAAFVAAHQGVEAVVMNIGIHSVQVVLVAESGAWARHVVESREQALELCERLGIPAHDAYPDHVRQRMGSFRRSPDDWRAAPYPERTRQTYTED